MKRPFFSLQYEQEQNVVPFNLVERGAEECAQAKPEDIDYPDLKRLFTETKNYSLKSTMKWIVENRESFLPGTYVTSIACNGNHRFPLQEDGSLHDAILAERPLHTIYELDKFLAHANLNLNMGGHIFCNSRTSAIKKTVIMRRYPWGVRWVVFLMHYFWHRVCPKLGLTKRLYFQVTKGKNRTFNRVELLGRLYRAGFEVRYEGTYRGEFFVLARKFRDPIMDDVPSSAPIIKLNRIGKDGKMIGVYKFRTMYSYSEYIQSYVYEYHHLQEGGKFNDDYRVNLWGKLLRATWLDEFPMIVNMLKGQMKLVGVRPLSPHYFSLYTPEMQALRIKVKPGLLPPFYYEKESPKTIEEVQDSERRYIEAYLQHPLRTDLRYLFGIIGNIIFRRKKSH